MKFYTIFISLFIIPILTYAQETPNTLLQLEKAMRMQKELLGQPTFDPVKMSILNNEVDKRLNQLTPRPGSFRDAGERDQLLKEMENRLKYPDQNTPRLESLLQNKTTLSGTPMFLSPSEADLKIARQVSPNIQAKSVDVIEHNGLRVIQAVTPNKPPYTVKIEIMRPNFNPQTYRQYLEQGSVFTTRSAESVSRGYGLLPQEGSRLLALGETAYQNPPPPKKGVFNKIFGFLGSGNTGKLTTPTTPKLPLGMTGVGKTINGIGAAEFPIRAGIDIDKQARVIPTAQEAYINSVNLLNETINYRNINHEKLLAEEERGITTVRVSEDGTRKISRQEDEANYDARIKALEQDVINKKEAYEKLFPLTPLQIRSSGLDQI